ncbi:MAG TPA: hypothetical protein VHS96_17995 [Bacteroidia bacterium]|nr:hypothetical protein [Bacteroidia bacterium]
MKAKELRKFVTDLVYEGKSYQTIFDELTARYPNRERDIAKVIADVPSLEQRRKYGMMNIALMVMLSLYVLFALLAAVMMSQSFGTFEMVIMLIPAILCLVLLYGVYIWQPRYYRLIGGIAAWALYVDLKPLLLNAFDPWSLIDITMMAIMLFLGFFLYDKLGGKYQLGTHRYKDAAGNIKFKQAVRWLN